MLNPFKEFQVSAAWREMILLEILGEGEGGSTPNIK